MTVPKNLKFGGGVADTVLNPAVLAVVVAVGLIILFQPRKKLIGPLVATSILIPMDQVLVLGGLHFPMLRLLALFGIVRLIREKVSSKAKIFTGGINKIDISVIGLVLFTAVAGILLFREGGEVVFQLGEIYSAFGVYFLLRFLIREKEDVIRAIRTFAFVSIFVSTIMTWEIKTRHNPYALLGGSRANYYATVEERDDKPRATGCFGHPILAGSFAAMMIPLFVLLWRERKNSKILAAAGIVAASLMVLASNSSTPILGYLAGVLALSLWELRNWMRVIRWLIVLTLVSLHMVMKAPVWHLIARIDLAGGSSSWHRFALIDQCIRHFADWWLIGVKSTAEWGWDMWDTANQYVSICDASGLLPFILFLSIIAYGFKYVGKARKVADTKKERLFFWALGSAVFANVVSFVGVSYWDQTQVAWYSLLAMISATAVVARKETKSLSKQEIVLSEIDSGAQCPQLTLQ
ncbi:MAG: hypothetical protein DMG61_04175 [Acidobacteria bacterium]|nr:MAG: hypothetical protein DMG61_04175 [Acidobacteriota bacterium]